MSKKWRQVSVVLFAAVVAAAILFALLWASSTPAKAQGIGNATPETTPVQVEGARTPNTPSDDGKVNPPVYANMDSLLNRIVQQVEDEGVTPNAAAANAPMHLEETVAVTLHIAEGQSGDVSAFLQGNGISPRNAGADYIEAYIPISTLVAASQQEGVIRMSAIVPRQKAQGTVVSEGAAVHGAPEWNTAGFTGEGVKVGIIDVGFIGYSKLMGTELPAAVKARCYSRQVKGTSDIALCEADDVHGTAVAEAVFDIAPKATFYIANPWSKGDLRDAVEWMISEGVTVVNHSVGWTWDGYGDGTSPYRSSPLNTIDAAVEGDILWANAAGNSALRAWLGEFSDADGDSYMEFTQGDENNLVFANAGSTIIVQMRWDDSWGYAASDLDLYLRDSTGEIVATSEDYQKGIFGDVPYELLWFTPAERGTFSIEVELSSGRKPGWVQLVSWNSSSFEHRTISGSITNPAESVNPGLLAVGASSWYYTNEIESFSSQGPLTDGSLKPDIVGADGASSVGYADEDNPEGRWYGTSQASPHVAGMAALVQQRFPALGPEQVADYLKQHAQERGAPGPDNIWGYGFAVLPSPSVTQRACFNRLDIGDELANLDGDSLTIEVEGSWDNDCESEKPPENGDARYARFYTFRLNEPANVTITLSSSEQDAYLYLMEGTGKSGTVLEENDDDFAPPSTDSQIAVQNLAAGSYTIEATTLHAEGRGAFTLSVKAESADPVPTPVPTPDPTPVPDPAPKRGYIDVSYGSDHACALHEDGSISCWGSNEYGKASPPVGEFKSVSSGEHGTCALRSDDGKIFCWGIFELNR